MKTQLNDAHAILQGRASASFCLANASKREAMVVLFGDSVALEFDPNEAERLALMFEQLAGLIRQVPIELERAITEGKIPATVLAPEPHKPDPNAN